MEQKSYNLDRLNQIAGGNESFVESMLATFMENVTNDIETVKTQKSAENWSAVAERAHKLASNFAYLNAENLKKQALDIEESVLNKGDLTGIAEKSENLCIDAAFLIERLKQDFDFLNND